MKVSSTVHLEFIWKGGRIYVSLLCSLLQNEIVKELLKLVYIYHRLMAQSVHVRVYKHVRDITN